MVKNAANYDNPEYNRLFETMKKHGELAGTVDIHS